MKKLLSIIIPTYNCKGFVHEGIESVLRQLPPDYELIIVDDGSDDGTVQRLKPYEGSQPNLRLYYKEHRGASAARNTGIEMAAGRYVTFMDCDDCIRDDFFKKSRPLLEDDADLYIFGIERIPLEGNNEYWTVQDHYYETASDFADTYIRSRKLLIYSNCNKFYRRSILNSNDLQFREDVSFGEDRLFNYDYLAACGAIETSSLIMLEYIQREGESMSSKYVPNYFDQVMKLHDAKIECFLRLSKNTSQEEQLDFVAYDLSTEIKRALQRFREQPEEREENTAQEEKTTREEKTSKYENLYDTALRQARDTKRLYLTNALEQEASALLSNIGIKDWSAEDRRRSYEQEVLPYWKKFGLRPKKMWFELYGSREHKMDPRFMPADLYYNDIMPYLNNGLQHHGLMNKGYLDYLFSDVKRPETVALKTEGVYMDERRNIIREDDAIGLCMERGGVLFLKRSTGSKFGKGIFVFEPETRTESEIRGIFGEAGASFIVQRQIRQHPQVAKLNPSSVSTIRILSLFLDDEVTVESAVLRVSGPDMPYVTVHDGGFYAEILEDGRLYPKVYDNNGAWYDNGKGAFDSSFVMPSMDKVYDEVRRIHPRLAHFKCIGWDFAIDEQGEPVLIEFNVFPGIDCSQTACCRPIFGDKTDRILEDFYVHRTWEKNHRQDILIY